MTPTATTLPTLDLDIPDGHLLGFDADGVLVVELTYSPTLQYLTGTPDTPVAEWRAGMDYVRRQVRILAWEMQGHPCKGGVM